MKEPSWDDIADLVYELTNHRIQDGDADWRPWLGLALSIGVQAKRTVDELEPADHDSDPTEKPAQPHRFHPLYDVG